MAKARSEKTPKTVETLKHDEATRRNIPTAEYQSVLEKEQQQPKAIRYPRNTDLDPQLVWRGKDEQDWSDLVVHAPPLYIQEKVHPKALIDDLLRQTRESQHDAGERTPDLFADFNGIPKGADKTEFYAHDQNWSNRMILGDSLQVMASLAEREGLRGQVQCIYFDPPYGIKFNSNFQWSTTSRDVKDGKADHITREPEQVKAFRDTWRDGIHSYLTYLRDRLTVARDLLTDTGSIFVQISDENIHLVRGLLDEVFGSEAFVAQISFRKTSPLSSSFLARINDYVLWFAKSRDVMKFRRLYELKSFGGDSMYSRLQFPDGTRRSMSSGERDGSLGIPADARAFAPDNTRSSGYTDSCFYPVAVYGFRYAPQKYSWKTHREGMERLKKAHRLAPTTALPYYVRFHEDFPVREVESHWSDTRGDMEKTYVVQTSSKVVERCMLMATDPGDLVLDPTCGSGTTATVAEQWGRRWITIDTSRVALALARARIMGARYPWRFQIRTATPAFIELNWVVDESLPA
jgi:adenine-specific DNA-methyltransferase